MRKDAASQSNDGYVLTVCKTRMSEDDEVE